MRVLLDECLPRKLKRQLPGHQVQTVPEAGWAGRKNGALLGLAVQKFDVFITIDGGIKHQQNITQFQLGIIILTAPSNDIHDLLPLVSDIQKALESIKAGEIVKIGGR